MKFTTLILALLTTFAVRGVACVDEFDPDPNKWMTVEQPDGDNWDKHEDFYSRANLSHHEWSVKLVGNEVTAMRGYEVKSDKENTPKFDTTLRLKSSQPDTTKKMAGRLATAHLSIKVSDGWLIAYNEGEFGSGVYWFSEDGKEKKWISSDHVNGFLVDGDRIFSAEGLAHMDSEGSIIEFQRDPKVKGKGNWKVTEFIGLTEAAEGDYVVVTTYKVLRFNLKKELLYQTI